MLFGLGGKRSAVIIAEKWDGFIFAQITLSCQ